MLLGRLRRDERAGAGRRERDRLVGQARRCPDEIRPPRPERVVGAGIEPHTDRLGWPAAGILHVNSQTAGADVHVPFGGIKGSGFGPHEQGRAALEFYTETVTVYQDAPLD